MQATVDKDTCIGCALCETTCPTVFTMEGDKAIVIVDTVPPEDEQACEQAAEDCPVTAIEVRG